MIKKGKSNRKEVWIVPRTEQRSQWDCGYVSKEMFIDALGLKVIGNLTADDEALTDENIPQVNQSSENVFESMENILQPEVDQDDEDTVIAEEKIQNEVICADCGKMFETKIRLNNHKENAHSGTQYCTLCPLEFTRK